MPKRTFYILLVAAFAAMVGMGVISPFLPELVRRHGANGFWMGMVFAGYAISRGLVMPFVGKASDRVGRKIFVAGGLFLFSLISLLYPWAHNVYNLMFVRMLHGLSAGMVIPMVMAYAGQLSEKHKKGQTAGSITMMFYMGLAAGPFLGGVIHHYLGFAAIFYAMSLLGFGAFLIVLVFLEDTKPPIKQEGIEVFNFHELIKYNFIKGLLIIAATMTFMMMVFLSFLPSLAESINIDPDHVGLILSSGIFLAGVLQVPFGKFSDMISRTGRLFQIGTGASFSMTALFVMPFCPDLHWLMAAGALLGTGVGIAVPAIMSLSMGIGERVRMGTWMGVTNTAMCVGLITAPVAAGIIMDVLGIHRVFYVLGAIAFFGGVLYYHYMRKRLRGYKK
jgi:MFS family permease